MGGNNCRGEIIIVNLAAHNEGLIGGCIMGYRLEYDLSKTWQVVLRNFTFLICIILDLIMIFNIVRAIMIDSMHSIDVVLCLVASVSLRAFAIHLCSNIEYEIFDETFVIKRKYILYSKKILDCHISKIAFVNIADNIICDMPTDLTRIDISDETSIKYNIYTGNINYICNIDEYMHSRLIERNGL